MKLCFGSVFVHENKDEWESHSHKKKSVLIVVQGTVLLKCDYCSVSYMHMKGGSTAESVGRCLTDSAVELIVNIDHSYRWHNRQ
jgi:hypothetical protein